jgi:hypothetical protein
MNLSGPGMEEQLMEIAEEGHSGENGTHRAKLKNEHAYTLERSPITYIFQALSTTHIERRNVLSSTLIGLPT